jgi:phenylpropionate dioxygenase-like ring-hydroxylating dioxygenase large terminal subunit
MFINFWYVAAESGEVIFGADRPLKVQMLGLRFALWRDSKGVVRCVSDTCSHRSGSLADGRIRKDCIECPYHGWTFNADGTCVRIPSMGPDARLPERTRVDSYPVVEKYGLVHVFLGDLPEAERPEIHPIPEFDDPSWRFIVLKMDWQIDYKRSVENTMDPAHNEFTHPTHGFLGMREDYKVEELTLIDKPWGTGFLNRMYAPPLPNREMHEASGRTGNDYSTGGVGNHGPNTTWTYIHVSDKAWMHGYAFHTPITDKLDRIYVLFGRNYLTDSKYDNTIEQRGLFIAEQDRYVLEPLQPKLTPSHNAHEFLVPADKAIGRYREYCRDWEARGWRIDTARLRADEDRVAYAIPSPGRRQSRNWVLPTVPLLPAGEQAARRARASGEE